MLDKIREWITYKEDTLIEIIAWTIILFLIAIFSGATYMALNPESLRGVVSRSPSSQTLTEGALVGIGYIGAFVGLYVLLKGMGTYFNIKRGAAYALFGITIFLFSFMLIALFFSIKISG